MEAEAAHSPKYDMWRDGPLRLLGYANEVGEAFRPLAPRLVVPSYVVAFAYVAVDTWDKGSRAYHNEAPGSQYSRGAATMAAVVDTGVWQTLASVVIPGLTINRVVALSGPPLLRSAASPALKRWGPTAIGLAVIPFIVHPIDTAVHAVMDYTLRPLLDQLVTRSGDDSAGSGPWKRQRPSGRE